MVVNEARGAVVEASEVNKGLVGIYGTSGILQVGGARRVTWWCSLAVKMATLE